MRPKGALGGYVLVNGAGVSDSLLPSNTLRCTYMTVPIIVNFAEFGGFGERYSLMFNNIKCLDQHFTFLL